MEVTPDLLRDFLSELRKAGVMSAVLECQGFKFQVVMGPEPETDHGMGDAWREPVAGGWKAGLQNLDGPLPEESIP